MNRDIFKPIFDRINKAANTNKDINAVIEGGSGSGKSTLARSISEYFECNLFHMDDFFLTPKMRTPKRLGEVGGNIDYIRFKSQVINQLDKENFIYEKYDCKTDTFNNVQVTKKRINIIEGVYGLHPLFRDAYNFKIFLSINPDIQKKRILERNGEAMLGRFLNEWIPLENLYFEKTNILNYCDLIINVSEF